jgi:hypothetical protein
LAVIDFFASSLKLIEENKIKAASKGVESI